MNRVSLLLLAAAVAIGCGGGSKKHDTSPRSGAAMGAKAGMADDRISSTDSGASASVTADEVLRLYVEATGGRAAYEKLHSRVTTGKIEMPSLGVKGSIEIYQQAPNKSYTKFVLGQAGTIEQGTDGTVVWERSAMTGARVLTGKERTAALVGAAFHPELKYKELYKSVELVGSENVDGSSAHKLLFTMPGGQTETRYYDKQTKLLVKSAAKLQHQMGEISSTSRFSDYRAVDGVQIPFTIEVSAMNQKRVLRLVSVQHNVAIRAERFAIPADIQKLLKK